MNRSRSTPETLPLLFDLDGQPSEQFLTRAEKARLYSRRRYREDPARHKLRIKQYAQNNRRARYANLLVYLALKKGKLIRQPCEVCGSMKADAHHDDYSKPLEVRWLCRSHHRKLHNRRVAA